MYADIDSTKGRRSVASFSAKSPAFVCVISYTATCENPGITVAGANPDLLKYTSPADAEFLYYGKCACIDSVPATPDGKPTPALLTRAALQEGRIPALVVDAGTRVKPSVPFVSFGLEPGRNIGSEPAQDSAAVQRALSLGQTLGEQLGRLSDLVVIGESIPGGTTTALAVMTALGVNARFRVSSSMPDNPHNLKNKIVEEALLRTALKSGGPALAIDAMATVGDPMMPSVAGIARGALFSGSRVMLAGGTQMAAVLLVLKRMQTNLQKLCIATTSYVLNDRSADLAGLVEEIAGEVPLLSCDLHLEDSEKAGLRAFSEGFVKEGVGAGGAATAAMLKSGMITGRTLRKAAEREYERSIEGKK